MAKQSKESVLADLHNHNVNLVTREIYLHSNHSKDDDGGEPGVDYRQATTFIKNLQFLDQPPNKPILIHLHSTGGCWDNGMAMYNAIQFCESQVTILAYSQASSMSGIILQSAFPNRGMMPDCHFMLHYGYIGFNATSSQAAREAVLNNEKGCKRMLNIFASNAIHGEFFKNKKSSTLKSVASYIDKKMKEKTDWYLDAEESVYYGFADFVVGSKDCPSIKDIRR